MRALTRLVICHPGAICECSPHSTPCLETTPLVACVQVAYFVNSGSEANDMAILMARLYSGNHDLIALRNGYHGISEGLLGVLGHSTWKYNVPSVSPHFLQTAAAAAAAAVTSACHC